MPKNTKSYFLSLSETYLPMSSVKNVAVYIFEEVEVLDFSGPFEVFSMARNAIGEKAFNTYLVGQYGTIVHARGDFQVRPKYSIDNCPRPDILLVPGGLGSRSEVFNRPVNEWIKKTAEDCELVLSVCTGALLLGKNGLLDGLEATTYHTAFDTLAEIAPEAKLSPGKRYVDNGKVILSAGVSAGIDMSLYVVSRLLGREQALATARYMEYDHNWEL